MNNFNFLGPTISHYFIINNLEPNSSHNSLSTKITSFSSLQNYTSTKKLGLVGDVCLKVMGDCSKFMECKKQYGLVSNFSTCQCINGYLVDFDRTCSKKFACHQNEIKNFF